MREAEDAEFISKICLGTAQFGMDYGIANRDGKPDTEEINRIFNFAFKSGISALDTAYSYGDSEEAIGKFIRNNNPDFRVISKLPPIREGADIEKIVRSSLTRLNIKSIYGYLIHKFDDFLKFPWLWEHLEGLKQKKLIEKIGFSVYTTKELEAIFDKNVEFDIIQAPYSVFDRRFESYLPGLKERKIEIYLRSIFLQGMVFLQKCDLTGKMVKAGDKLEELRFLSQKNNIPINALCFDFVLLNPYLDKLIVGVDKLAQLKAALDSFSSLEQVRNVYNDLKQLSLEDEDILLPYRWVKQ